MCLSPVGKKYSRRGRAVGRRAVLWLFWLSCLACLSGCAAGYHHYVNREADAPEEAERIRDIRGSVNVILLPGCAVKTGEQDTLFSCLQLSRDVNPDSVKLPPGEKLYLGHVAEFIVRAFKYYQLQESFKDFYGHRIILKFRKMTPQEIRSRKFDDYSGFAVGTAGTVAGLVTLLPIGVVLFLADGVKAEIGRQDFEDRVARMGLPPPKKNIITQKIESGGRTLLYLKDSINQELTGKSSERIQFDDKVAHYVVEECILEKVTAEELTLYREQIQRLRKL